jgi:SecD/SecF fusion protein
MNGVELLIRPRPGGTRSSGRIVAVWLGLYIVMVAGCGLLSSGEDLASQGSVTLVYEIDLAAAKQQGTTVDPAVMDKMVAAITKRLNASGARGFVVRPMGADRIEVTIPGNDPERIREAKSVIVKLGTLEFAIVANERNDRALIDQAMRLPDNQNELATELSGARRIVAAWHDLTDPKPTNYSDSGIGFRSVRRLDPETGTEVDVPQVLVKHDPPNRAVTGAYLTSVRGVIDELDNPAVSFRLNSKGAGLFRNLTSENLPDEVDGSKRQLAILLDGRVHSAPTINGVIGGDGQITGRFTKQEIDNLVAVLNAGALPVPLKPIPVSETTTSPPPKTDAPK